MKIGKRRTLTLTLALCAVLINAPVVLAETATTEANTSVETVETTSVTEVTNVSETSRNTEVTTDTEATEGENLTEGTETADSNEPETATDGEVADPAESTEGSDQTTETDLPPVVDENGEVVEPGTLPDSPFYWLTLLIEKLQVVLTFDPVEKTELLEEQALERIAEAQEMIEEGNTEEAEVVLQAYSEKVTEAQAFLATLTETDSETKQKLETAMSNTHAKNIQTLGGLLDKLPPQASQKVALNIVRSMEKTIAKMEKKEQQQVAKALRKATKNADESDLAQEDQEALDNLDQVLEQQEGEGETVAAGTDTSLTTMALSASTLKINVTDTSKVSQQNASQISKGAVSEPKPKANTEVLGKQKEQATVGNKPEAAQGQKQSEQQQLEQKQQEQELKQQEQKQSLEQQESKTKAEPDSTVTGKDSGSNNSSQKNGGGNQEKSEKASSGEKSSEKGR